MMWARYQDTIDEAKRAARAPVACGGSLGYEFSDTHFKVIGRAHGRELVMWSETRALAKADRLYLEGLGYRVRVEELT